MPLQINFIIATLTRVCLKWALGLSFFSSSALKNQTIKGETNVIKYLAITVAYM